MTYAVKTIQQNLHSLLSSQTASGEMFETDTPVTFATKINITAVKF